MNKKIAISLVLGCIFAILTARFTRTTHYYYRYHEISKAEYYGGDEERTAIKYNDAFILIGLIGGIGVGYLISGLVFKKQ